jgi:threonine/homoserine/homoserine lactone efflux protein
MLSMIVIVALGLQAVMSVIASAFTIIKLAGAAYLIWIGWKMFHAGGHIDLNEPAEPLPLRRYLLQGALINWSNPKTLLFLGAFLPQFVDLTRPAFPQIMVLGLIVMAVATLTDTFYAVLAGRMRSLLTATRIRVMNRVGGGVLMIGGVALALVRRS